MMEMVLRLRLGNQFGQRAKVMVGYLKPSDLTHQQNRHPYLYPNT